MTSTTRRKFIRNLVIAAEPAAGRQTLVCVFLRGGADMLNLVVPCGDDRYYRLRPTIAIPAPKGNEEATDAAIRLDDYYGFHPKLRPLLRHFREGRLGIVQSVGSDNTSGSHFEAQDQMEHGESMGRTIGGGWLGRYLRLRAGREMTPLSAIAIGPTIPESLRGAPQASALSSLEDIQLNTPSNDSRTVTEALAAMYGASVGLLRQPGQITIDLLARVERLRNRDYHPEGDAVYPDEEFGHGLREVARLVKAEMGLEVACIDLSGWDTHFFQGTTDGLQATQIDLLARGLAAFDADLNAYRDRVTILVLTEFGRRVYENGSLGTDHGRGFAMLALGDRIQGGRVLGEKPDLSGEEPDLLGPGGLQVAIDYRSVLSEILVGVLGCRSLSQVFPNFMPQKLGIVVKSEWFSYPSGRV